MEPEADEPPAPRAAPDPPPTAQPSPGARTAPQLGPVSRLVYRALRLAILAVARLWVRVEVCGTEHIPRHGPFILAPGAHRSNLDTPIISVVTPRILRYMGKEGLWRVPGLRWFLTALGGFPVQRSLVDREALRRAEEVLGRGEPLVVFPEGTRKRGPIIVDVKDGAAFLACRAGVPIVPVGLGGTERAMGVGSKLIRPTKVVILIGEPIHPPARAAGERVKRSQVRQLTTVLHERLQDLFDRAQVSAGV
jgi:1-acyl-sn-glycerol-3-phosphate acyltransferase